MAVASWLATSLLGFVEPPVGRPLVRILVSNLALALLRFASRAVIAFA